MRRVALVVWSAGACAMSALLAPAAWAAEPASAGAAVKEDYYTRRAKNVLEAERKAADKPHPLAARYPGKDIVVCEAGCPDRKGPKVVYLRPHVAVRESGTPVTEGREGRMVPTSASGADAPSSEPVCVAGCYASLTSAAAATAEPDPAWYPSTPRAPAPPRDKLSPVR